MSFIVSMHNNIIMSLLFPYVSVSSKTLQLYACICHKGSANIASLYLFLICRITSEDIKNQESKLRFVPCLSSFSRFGCDNFARPRSWSVSESIKLYNTAGSGGVVLCSLQPHLS